MSLTPARGALRPSSRPVDLPVAAVAWIVAFFVGQTLSTIVLLAAGVDDTDEASIPVLFTAVAATWIAYLAGTWWASQRSGTGSLVEDYAIRLRPVDAIGVPVGVLTQLVLVPLVYSPLVRLWPDTFTDDRLEETAKELVDRADGAAMWLLVVMVCIGAPLVEEILYRGMLQGSLAARVDQRVAVVAIAAWFALIHFRPVEYPGLFAFGLVVGVAAMLTRRLGMSIATHIAFNATGLALAWR